MQDNFEPFKFETGKTKKYIVSRIFLAIFMFIGILGFFSARWYNMIYGDVGAESVIFSVFAGVGGVQEGLVNGWLINGLLPSVFVTLLGIFVFLFVPFLLYKGRDEERFEHSRKIASVLAFASFLFPFAHAFCAIGLDKWTYNLLAETKIYEEEYVEPDSVKVSFPQNKRNLIYIYLESMETTFFSEELGGDLKENTIPELYELAASNTNFSQNSKVGGGRSPYGTTWTIGAMISHTAGIPMRAPVSVNAAFSRKFYNGTTTINNILKENGYNQAVMVGSDAQYGGRKEYFLQHGVDAVYDIKTAYDDGIVPSGYFHWWGMEDKHLFSYAKKKLTQMSSGDKPFAFTLLTVDTHHVDGYKCSECEDEFGEQYKNVLACSSRQVSAFVEWIKQQDFYENTTIVITGDHPTMDYQFVKHNTEERYIRRIYNCFINAVPSAENSKNREFLSFDMFPTTLAAMGCKIQGERLGLGTNLFSGSKTLTEKYGYDYVESEIAKRSDYYNRKFD